MTDVMAAGLGPRNNPVTLQTEMVAPGGRVLIAGHVEEDLAGALAARAAELVGVEMTGRPGSAPAPFSVIVEASPRGLDYLAAFGPSAFDAIVLADPLDAITGAPALLRSLARVLKPGGRLVLTAHNRAHGAHRLAALRGLGPAPGTPSPTMTFPAAAAAVAAAGLALVEAKAVVSDPLAPPDAAPERAASDLPEAVIDWVRAQPGAYEFLYVLRAALPTPTALGAAAHVRPVPAAPLPAPASGPGATPGEAPAGPRIEALITQTLAAMERQALRDRDAVIGGEVAAATFRKDLERLAGAFTEAQAAMRAQLAAHETALRREAKLRVERERLATARRYERSVSWRIGRIATAPLRIVRALVARR